MGHQGCSFVCSSEHWPDLQSRQQSFKAWGSVRWGFGWGTKKNRVGRGRDRRDGNMGDKGGKGWVLGG